MVAWIWGFGGKLVKFSEILVKKEEKKPSAMVMFPVEILKPEKVGTL